MARLPRLILPNTPHHVTQRGNRRQPTFFCDDDYTFYRQNLFELSETTKVDILAYCLMPNHVHLILVPESQRALTQLVSELHQRYTRHLNFQKGWRGHLWQGRFFSVPLSSLHLKNCIQYVEQNPIRANIVSEYGVYKWQSHSLAKDTLDNTGGYDLIRSMTRTGRPQGDEEFLNKVLELTGFDPRPKPSGPKPRVRVQSGVP